MTENSEYFARVAEKLKQHYGIANFAQPEFTRLTRMLDDYERLEGRVHYLKTLDQHRSLFAVKLKTASGERFVPVIRDRQRGLPMDVLPEESLVKVAPRLRYTTHAVQNAFSTTREAMVRNYGMRTLAFDVYTKMCELCRTGKSEPSKFRVRGHYIHRVRLYLGANATFPTTFFVLWDTENQLIVGAVSRSTAESFRHASETPA